jgi:hypothetical protein
VLAVADAAASDVEPGEGWLPVDVAADDAPVAAPDGATTVGESAVDPELPHAESRIPLAATNGTNTARRGIRRSLGRDGQATMVRCPPTPPDH